MSSPLTQGTYFANGPAQEITAALVTPNNVGAGIFSPAPNYSFPAGFPPGSVWRVAAAGTISGGTPNNPYCILTLVGLGTTLITITGPSNTNSSTAPWRAEMVVRIKAAVASYQVVTEGWAQGLDGAHALTLGATTGATAVATSAANFTLNAEASSSTGLTIQCYHWLIEQLN